MKYFRFTLLRWSVGKCTKYLHHQKALEVKMRILVFNFFVALMVQEIDIGWHWWHSQKRHDSEMEVALVALLKNMLLKLWGGTGGTLKKSDFGLVAEPFFHIFCYEYLIADRSLHYLQFCIIDSVADRSLSFVTQPYFHTLICWVTYEMLKSCNWAQMI